MNKKTPYGKNINPTYVPVDEKQSIEEYNLDLNKQDETLDSFLMEIDTTIASVETEYMPVKAKYIQKSLLSLMSLIHNEIAPTINEMRHGLTTGFCREEDKYIPESNKQNYVSLIGII